MEQFGRFTRGPRRQKRRARGGPTSTKACVLRWFLEVLSCFNCGGDHFARALLCFALLCVSKEITVPSRSYSRTQCFFAWFDLYIAKVDVGPRRVLLGPYRTSTKSMSRLRACPGGPRRHQKPPGGPMEPQEAPGGPSAARH